MNPETRPDNDCYTREMPSAVDFCDNVLDGYTQWLFSFFRHHLGSRVLEVGAGTGRFSRLLSCEPFSHLFLLEPSLVLGEALRTSTGIQRPGIEIISADARSFNRPSLYGTLDSIVIIQVLEHIEDDAGAVAHLSRYLKKGGNIIIQVPAMKWLYGHWDEQIGHFRRYVKRDLRRLAEAAGCDIEEMFYFNMLGIAGWWYNFCLLKKDFRRTSEHAQLSLQGRLFDSALLPIMAGCEKCFHPPVGLGLHAVFKKR